MRHKLVVLFLLMSTTAWVKAQITEIQLPPFVTDISRLDVGSDGRLWVAAVTSAPKGVLLTAPADGTALATISGDILLNATTGFLFKSKTDTQNLSAFFPMGDQSFFGEATNGPVDNIYAANAATGQGKYQCTNYVLEKGSFPANFWGPFPGPDGKQYAFGTDGAGNFQTVKSRWFRLDTSTCKLTTLINFADQIEFVQIWPWTNGSCAAERGGFGNPSKGVGSYFSEIVTCDQTGTLTTWISSNSGAKIHADRCCDLVMDRDNLAGMIIYHLAGKVVVKFWKSDNTFQDVALQDGTIVPPTTTSPQYGTDPITRVFSLHGRWGLFGSNSFNYFDTRMDSLEIADQQTGMAWNLLRVSNLPTTTQFPVPFLKGTATMDKDGNVYFAVLDKAEKPHLYKVAVPVIDPITAQAGKAFKLTGKNLSNLTFPSNAPFTCSADLTCVATSTVGSYTTQGTVRYGNGSILPTNPIPVTIGTIASPKPVISSVMPATGSTKAGLTPGSLFTIFGTELAGVVSNDAKEPGNVTDNTQPALPKIGTLYADYGRCRVYVDDKLIPLTFAITWDQSTSPRQAQINGELPWMLTPGKHLIVVERHKLEDDSVDQTSAAFTITVVPNSPSLFLLPQSGLQAVLWDNSDNRLITDSHPAHPGSILNGYALGLGPLQTNLPDGEAPTDVGMTDADLIQIPTKAWVQVKINGQWSSYAADFLYGAAAPQFVGVNQFGFAIPLEVVADADSTIAYLILEQDGVLMDPVPFAFNPSQQ